MGAGRLLLALMTNELLTDVCMYIPWRCRRFYLEIAAKRRFRVGREWEQDGYRVALPLPLADEAPPAEGPAAEELAELVKDVEAAADAWTARVSCVFRWSLQCVLTAVQVLRAEELADLMKYAEAAAGGRLASCASRTSDF